MCYVELESCDFWRESKRKASKEHKCDSCGGLILRGEEYTSHFSVSDGEATSEKMCGGCGEARDVFAEAHSDSDGAYIPTPGGFPELLSDCISDGDEASEKTWRPMLEALHARGAAEARKGEEG